MIMCEDCEEQAKEIPVKNVSSEKKKKFTLDRDTWISIACCLILLAYIILVWEVL
jgi:hypothetical protein